MLILTPTAAQAVHSLLAHRDIDDDTGGLRIAARDAPEPGATLKLDLVDRPQVADAHIESAGAHVFVERALTEVLDDKVLDARVEGGLVRFSLLEPSDADPR